MQRLFTTFPIGWPAAGLLLLRLSAGVPLIVHGISATHRTTQPLSFTLPALSALSGVLLLFGLWTPLVGLSAVFIELSKLILRSVDGEYHILLAALALSLVMLGPGAWSIDARLFGRRSIDF